MSTDAREPAREDLLASANKPAEISSEYHAFYRGKTETALKCAVRNLSDFSIWYTPGVAAPCRAIAERLRGHVVCLEQIVKRSIQCFGFEHVKAKVVPASDCDTALRAAFGSGLDAVESNAVHSLDARIRYLRELEVDMLACLS